MYINKILRARWPIAASSPFKPIRVAQLRVRRKLEASKPAWRRDIVGVRFTKILRQIYLPRLSPNGYRNVLINRRTREKTNMRHFTLATGLAVALAAMFSLAPAKAEMGGMLANGKGQCQNFNGNSTNLTFYYWGSCPCNGATACPAAQPTAAIVHRHHHKG
jgi:hypothetical protein